MGARLPSLLKDAGLTAFVAAALPVEPAPTPQPAA